jgi:hypothetical protein
MFFVVDKQRIFKAKLEGHANKQKQVEWNATFEYTW